MNKYLLFAGAVFLFSTRVQAQPANLDIAQLQDKIASAGDAEFSAMDTNDDGLVSYDEYLEYVLEETRQKSSQAFGQIDQDGDGNVSHEEYSQFMNFATGKMNEFFNQLRNHTQ